MSAGCSTRNSAPTLAAARSSAKKPRSIALWPLRYSAVVCLPMRAGSSASGLPHGLSSSRTAGCLAWLSDMHTGAIVIRSCIPRMICSTYPSRASGDVRSWPTGSFTRSTVSPSHPRRSRHASRPSPSGRCRSPP
eukprot:3149534-Prymnesium_polylepis.2